MEMNFNEVKAIIDTLPIGFYTERRISAELSDKIVMSCYDPEHDTIQVAYSQVICGIKHYKGNPETLIRSNFYHEVSHALLTPKALRPSDVVNIFEDERIETLLNGYYYDVDFKKTLYAINGIDSIDDLPESTDPLEKFYKLVRFRKCDSNPELVHEVDRIIKEYSKLNRYSNAYESSDYEIAIGNLAKKCGVTFPYKESSPNITDKLSCEISEKTDKSDKKEKQGKTLIPDKGRKNTLSKEQIKKMFAEIINSDMDYNFYKIISILFEQFKKKNSKGSAISGYSGILNPRNADRTDYKIFERSQALRGNNSFGTFHLNLFIDVSGSYSSNAHKTNQIIKCLNLIERSNKNFTFDVITMSMHIEELPKEKRFIRCGGGNYLSKKIEGVYRKHQLPNTYNYNIVLFDGDAYSDYYPNRGEPGYPKRGMGFAIFNNNNTTIISDTDNKGYIQKYAPNVKTIFTNNYVVELTDNIVKIISKALN